VIELAVGAAQSLQDLDFDLPASLVARRPCAQRDACRLLCVQRHRPGPFVERAFRDLAELLRDGDLVVRNVSRVLPARLRGRRLPGGGEAEVLLLEPAAGGTWWALVRPGRHLRHGACIELASHDRIGVVEVAADGRRRVEAARGDLLQIAWQHGEMPLPPYVHRAADAADRDDYQTVYARVDGSVAAPTAGLHFTTDLLARLARRGIAVEDIVLHVGQGTFEPVRAADPRAHVMHWERFEVPAATLAALDSTRAGGGRVVAVGTTVARTLESIARPTDGDVETWRTAEGVAGRTRLFLYPPQELAAIDVLVTNFHLPRTTLLLLVDAFAGRETRRAAYTDAIGAGFRFFSYGDAMWIE
jgi:S-adenosylmethionine:tRNA ribosyltransferase-isomerase